jgi:hypothetical protein
MMPTFHRQISIYMIDLVRTPAEAVILCLEHIALLVSNTFLIKI